MQLQPYKEPIHGEIDRTHVPIDTLEANRQTRNVGNYPKLPLTTDQETNVNDLWNPKLYSMKANCFNITLLLEQ